MFWLLLMLAWCFNNSAENIYIHLIKYVIGVGLHQDSLKAIYYLYSGKWKTYSCGQIWFLRMPDASFEMMIFTLLKKLLSLVKASSKNNANTVPISGGRAGCGGYFT